MRHLLAIIVGMFAWSAAATAEGFKVVEVKKVWDQAPHNAFTDLIRFHDRWFLSFREAETHVKGDGQIRVLTSTDGKKWEAAARIGQKGIDLRDPKLSITPDDRLMIVGGAAVPATRNPLTDHYSFVCFSKDGKEWSQPERVLDSWQWLWRVTWHEGTGYGVAYRWNHKNPAVKVKREASLYRTKDGLKYELAADFDLVNANEATVRFDGAKMICLQRRDGEPNTAQIGTSQSPYKEWIWKDVGFYYGGPNFIQLPDKSWVACGRIIEKGKAQTVVCHMDIEKGKLIPAVTLPSGGDTSYAGLVWHDDQLWISYYSSHEGKTSIYLARLKRE
ncbi:MAG: sialidase family protein [Gemmataceae bacterium]